MSEQRSVYANTRVASKVFRPKYPKDGRSLTGAGSYTAKQTLYCCHSEHSEESHLNVADVTLLSFVV